MGNIWMFPYRLGQYGGAAFLIPYILFVVLFGFVGLSAEFATAVWQAQGHLVLINIAGKAEKGERSAVCSVGYRCLVL